MTDNSKGRIDQFSNLVIIQELTKQNKRLHKEREHVFKDAYKAGFDHGLTCDPYDVKKLNEMSSSIRLFDYQLEHYIREAADRYFNQKPQETTK